MYRRSQEILIGDMTMLDVLASNHDDMPDHPLQHLIEELVDELLTEREQKVFYMRFGQRLPHRAIARELGFKSHFSVQRIEAKIMTKIKEGLRAKGVS